MLGSDNSHMLQKSKRLDAAPEFIRVMSPVLSEAQMRDLIECLGEKRQQAFTEAFEQHLRQQSAGVGKPASKQGLQNCLYLPDNAQVTPVAYVGTMHKVPLSPLATTLLAMIVGLGILVEASEPVVPMMVAKEPLGSKTSKSYIFVNYISMLNM